MTSGIRKSAIYVIPNLFLMFGGAGTPVARRQHFDRTPTTLWHLVRGGFALLHEVASVCVVQSRNHDRRFTKLYNPAELALFLLTM